MHIRLAHGILKVNFDEISTPTNVILFILTGHYREYDSLFVLLKWVRRKQGLLLWRKKNFL